MSEYDKKSEENEIDDDKEFEILWKNWGSRRKCEAKHRAHKMSSFNRE